MVREGSGCCARAGGESTCVCGKRASLKAVATRNSELRASVDAKVNAAVKEALEQVADALECACCFEPLAPGTAVALECGHTYCNRQACASSSVTECLECRQPSERACRSLGCLPTCWGFCPATPDALRRARMGGEWGREREREEREKFIDNQIDDCRSVSTTPLHGDTAAGH